MGEIYKYRGIGYAAPVKEGRATSPLRKRVGLRRSRERGKGYVAPANKGRATSLPRKRLDVARTPRSGRKRGWRQDVGEEGDREGGVRTGD